MLRCQAEVVSALPTQTEATGREQTPSSEEQPRPREAQGLPGPSITGFEAEPEVAISLATSQDNQVNGIGSGVAGASAELTAEFPLVEAACPTSAAQFVPEASTAASASCKSTADATAPVRSRMSRSGALALQAKAAKEKQRREQEAAAEQQRREEAAEREMRATCSQVIAQQDAEFHKSLLHDQLKDLMNEREELQLRVMELKEQADNASQVRQNAEIRLARYGDNPKRLAELEQAHAMEEEVAPSLEEAQTRLTDVQAAISEKEELLAVALAAED